MTVSSNTEGEVEINFTFEREICTIMSAYKNEGLNLARVNFWIIFFTQLQYNLYVNVGGSNVLEACGDCRM